MAAALASCYQLNGWLDAPASIGIEQLRIAGLRDELFRLLLDA